MKGMGKVIVNIRLTNYSDSVLFRHRRMKFPPRSLEVEALVDTAATGLYLKPSVIAKLGLSRSGTMRSRATNGLRIRKVYEPVTLKLMGRSGAFNVAELDEDLPNLLGQIPLEYLDFIVDPKSRVLRINPEHGGEQMTEIFALAG
jgi:predicted aspartyl protease